MFTIEIAKGPKAKYSVHAVREEHDDAMDLFRDTVLEGEQRLRIKDAEGSIIERRKAEDQVTVPDDESANQDDATETETVEYSDLVNQDETASVDSEQESEQSEKKEYSLPIPDTVNELFSHGPVIGLKEYPANVAWETAIDVVNYPTYVMPAYGMDENGEYHRADGVTNTGRDTEFYIVYTDAHRIGELNAVATMTGRFRPIRTAETYMELRDTLESGVYREDKQETDYVPARPNSVYISGDGGRQRLLIDCEREGLDGRVNLQLQVDTSVDGSSSHTLSMTPRDAKTGVSLAGLYGGVHQIASKHTVVKAEETIHFGPAFGRILEAWETDVMPALKLLNDSEYDREAAMQECKRLAENSGIGQRHVKRILEETRIGTASTMTGYELVHEICQYVENEGKSPEWIERVQEKMEKGVLRMLNRLEKGDAYGNNT